MRKVGTSKAPKKLTSVRPKDFRIYEKYLSKGSNMSIHQENE